MLCGLLLGVEYTRARALALSHTRTHQLQSEPVSWSNLSPLRRALCFKSGPELCCYSSPRQVNLLLKFPLRHFFSSSPSRRNAESGGYQVQSASNAALGVLTTSYVLSAWRQVDEGRCLKPRPYRLFSPLLCMRWTNFISCTCCCCRGFPTRLHIK